MRSTIVAAVLLSSAVAHAADSDPKVAKREPHATPRAKLSYRHFSIGNLDGTLIPLDGAELDAYLVSDRWFRFGIELEGGAGKGTYSGYDASLGYGLLGLVVGVQQPGRVTPFFEGRAVAGGLGGTVQGTLSPGLTVMNAGATTYLYGGGLDVGVEVYSLGRSYLSLSIGWVWTTWRGVDAAALQGAQSVLKYEDITGSAVTFKLGVGL